VVALNSVFVWEWMRYIRERGGTRGIHYATPIGLQEDLARTICAHPDTAIQVRNHTVLRPFTIDYGISAEPTCRDKHITVCDPQACSAVAPGGIEVVVEYARTRGGAVQVREVRKIRDRHQAPSSSDTTGNGLSRMERQP
jgi:hypothetical protein